MNKFTVGLPYSAGFSLLAWYEYLFNVPEKWNTTGLVENMKAWNHYTYIYKKIIFIYKYRFNWLQRVQVFILLIIIFLNVNFGYIDYNLYVLPGILSKHLS